MLNVIISGVVTGVLYGLAGLGLVVVYRASKVMNFAMGGMGAIVAYLASDMLKAGLPYWLVFVLAIVAGALLGGIVEFLVARPLRRCFRDTDDRPPPWRSLRMRPPRTKGRR